MHFEEKHRKVCIIKEKGKQRKRWPHNSKILFLTHWTWCRTLARTFIPKISRREEILRKRQEIEHWGRYGLVWGLEGWQPLIPHPSSTPTSFFEKKVSEGSGRNPVMKGNYTTPSDRRPRGQGPSRRLRGRVGPNGGPTHLCRPQWSPKKKQRQRGMAPIERREIVREYQRFRTS